MTIAQQGKPMLILQDGETPEILDDGIILQQLDDLCFVRLGECTVNALRTRELGQRLIAFIEKAGCRKLVMSFEDVDSIYGFLLDNPPPAPQRQHVNSELSRVSRHADAGSDLWLG